MLMGGICVVLSLCTLAHESLATAVPLAVPLAVEFKCGNNGNGETTRTALLNEASR